MSTLQDPSELLASIEAPGAFATRRATSADNLHLEVKGVGRIRWPISRTTARRLCTTARPARYGLKDQTRFDPRVRDTFEIPKTRVRIDERRWRSTFRPMLDRVRRDLGLPDVHESWSCEDDDFGFGRCGRGSRWRPEYDEDAEQDVNGSETPALVELLDSDIELRHWTGSGKRLEAIAGAVDRGEVCYTKPSVELEPFASEHEGYMGNWGNTVDRWYHRAAVVLWPRARTFVIRAKASPRWAIDELTTTLRARDIEKAREMARQLVPFWSRVAPAEERRDFLARTLAVAGGLESAAVAASLLEPFTLKRLTPSAAARLVPLADGYGLRWCVTILESWTSEKRQGRGEPDTAWLTSLPNVCRALCDGGSAQGFELARWLVAKQWAAVTAHLRGLRELPNPKVAIEVFSRMSKPDPRPDREQPDLEQPGTARRDGPFPDIAGD